MKKQIKQKQDDTQAKQNTNRNSDASANENRTPVSDETKQKLVKQYADRAEKESSKQNPVDWGYFNSPKFGSPVDERKQIANSAEVSPTRELPYGARWGDFDLPKNFTGSDGGFPEEKHRGRQSITQGYTNGDYIAPAETYAPNQNINAYQGPDASALQEIVDYMTDDTMQQLSAYRNNINPDYNIKANPLYGYGQDLRDFYTQYGAPANWPENYQPISAYLEDVDPELFAAIEDSGAADTYAKQADLSRAFNLMENYNAYARENELNQWAQDYRNDQLYGDTLRELQARQAQPTSSRSLVKDAIQEARHQQHMDDLARRARQRNITGSGVVNW